MKRQHTTPRYYARNAAVQAQRRFLRTRKTEAERLDDHREETGNVLIACILAAIAALGADDRKPVKLHVAAEGVRVAGVGQFCPVALHIAALRGKLFLCLTVRQTEKRVSGHSVRPPVLCCVWVILYP